MNVSDGDGAASQDGRAYELQIYPRLAQRKEACCSLKVSKEASAASVIQDVAAELGLDSSKRYVLAEVKESGGEEWVLEANDLPVHRVLLWPRKAQERHPQREGFYFLLQERNHDGTIRYVHLSGLSKEQEAKQLVARGFLPPRQEDFDDLCNLPELKEDTILDNLRIRFHKKKIYTYAGSILIAINPFKFLPIYNPKYVKMYENHQLGKLEPHIFAIADVAYYTMLRKHVNQCIVISGESGSGKTQSTNFLIHCLTALSQKGYASGVERTILGAGPVLEAFGNAKTAHNNNSSRFGKFIQVNYLESGVVRGAVVEKYLLEKSRLVSREKNERNYHVFYYLLMGATDEERKEFKLLHPEDYLYLKQQSFKIEDEEDICHDFERLQQAMEMVGFLPATKKQIFSVLSAILYLGNVTYRPKSNGRDEGLDVGPPDVLTTLSDLLRVKEELLVEALTKRKTVTVNDKLILPYSHSQAITARDSMAKSLYSALFDWIVLRINHALLNKKDMEESVPCLSIGVLDIFGFEDFATNSFEQFCINYANEQLQYYFNQHIFKLEQEEYKAEGITWHNIDYTDNVGCIHLISRKPTGLLQLLDEESNFPHATDKTLLAKFKQQHNNNKYFVDTPVMEPAFVIRHFAGTVKYQIKDFREKNTDFMRPDIVALLRSSDRAYVRQLIGMDPVAMFRWGILRATIRAMAAFNEAGRHWAAKTAGVRRPSCRTPLGELQTANTPIEKIYRDMHTQIINSIKDLQLDCEDPRKLLQSWGRLRFPRHLLQKNKGTKQKQLIPKNLLDSCTLKFIVSLTLHDRTTKSLLHLHKKKKPPSISAQFQTSLSKLLETLGKAEPFFIRCLRSNSEKKEMFFDETLIVQQLRYTGMLETVRIRRSGYGAKYTFQDFLEQFRVLLPRNSCASQEDISVLLQKLGLDNCNYQIGKTKVFLKEPERQKLQDALHMDVMCKILFLQHWFRAKLKRREYLQKRASAVIIQHCWRRFRKERLRQAAILLQAQWRGYSQRVAYQGQLACILRIQALTRGNLARRRCQSMKDEKKRRREEEERRRIAVDEARRLAEEEARRQAEEQAAKRLAEEEQARKRAAAEEEARRQEEARLAEAAEAVARKARDEKEASRKEAAAACAREQEEAARTLKSQEEETVRLALEAEQQAALQRAHDTFESTDQSSAGTNTTAPLAPQRSPDQQEIQDVGRSPVQPHTERMEGIQSAPHSHKVNSTPTQASPEAGLKQSHQNKVSGQVPEEQRTNEVLLKPDRSMEQTAAIVADTMQPRTPQLGKLPPSRSQEKRELRRQRGLEHTKLVIQRTASVNNDDSASMLKGQDSPSAAEGKLKERSDSKELDQYTFVAWKEKGKKEIKNPPPFPVRPCTLPLDSPNTKRERNGHKESSSPSSPSHGTLQGSHKPGDSQDKTERGKMRRSETEPENLSPESQIPRNRKTNLQKRDISVSLNNVSTIESSGSNRASGKKVSSPSEQLADGQKMGGLKGHQETGQHPPSTPESRKGFLKMILKKRKEPQTPEDGEITLAQAQSERSAEALPSQPSRPHQHPEATGGRLVRNPTIKISRATRVKEWDASLNREITNANELRHLDELLGNQVNDLRSRGKQLSATEDLFMTATKEFRETIKSMYSQQKPHHSYRVLMNSYELKVIALAGEKQKSEVQLVVNLFQSVLDGFIRGEMKKGEAEQVKPKARKKRRKKDKSFDSPLDHMFSTYQVSIMQSCDQCFSYIWAMEKACMCSFCKMVCHKKCLSKITTDCTSNCSKKMEDDPNSQHFGVRLCHLINDKTPVPVVLAIMLEHIEMNGLYSEGIYRKSGSANRMKELYQRLQADPNSVCLEDYPIHTVTGLVKQWLRELPDPLMTFTHYSDFLRATELPEKLDQIPAIYKVLELLPPSHFNTLERLIFHLVRVSKEEVNNRMNPNSLAIVFAPCILRCPDSADPLMSMKDVAKTTMCVEMIINEQIRKYNDKMEEIEQLEYAEALAVNQLKLKRQATCCHLPLRYCSPPVERERVREKGVSNLHVVPENEPFDTEIERTLMERIKSIKEEKEDLAFRLPELEQPGSDQENLDSEASLSSESLLDDRSINSDTEGKTPLVLKEPRPVCLPEPPDSALRPKPMSVGPTSALLSAERLQTQRRIPIIPGTVKLPHGVTASATAMPPSSLQTWSLAMVQRRIQPGRRKDSIQSLYIAPGSELSASPPSVPCDLQSAATTKRRFSNPDIPYIDD
ncbi:unconventional myosin-IXb isoform X4 [Denticeps clupeoides]|uniref:unconventional myosin-IXb isoform X4 n=1 Tax=Denticeps clupeoides TaxID=299321 RepID=UPI0010A429F9|nr:unconventional myosin-IXb isoform X4 [Denticeps clupeoides]